MASAKSTAGSSHRATMLRVIAPKLAIKCRAAATLAADIAQALRRPEKERTIVHAAGPGNRIGDAREREGAQANLGAAGRCLRDVHAEPRFDRDRHRLADDRAFFRRKPVAAQRGDHLLSVEPRRVHPDQRLDRRPVRRSPCVQRCDRGFHLGLDRLRLRQFAPRSRHRAHCSGYGRGDDGAGRPSGAVADGAEIRSGARHVLCQRSGADRTGDGAAARRLYRHLRLLALDLLHQHPDRRFGDRAGQSPRQQPEGDRPPAFRLPGFCVDRHRAGDARLRL